MAQRWAIPIAAVVAVFSFALLQVLHHYMNGTGADFRALLAGAGNLAHGADIYGPALGFLDGGHLRQILTLHSTPYVYPPPLALLLRPLTLVPPAVAMVLWDALNVSLLALLFVLIVRCSQARSLRELVIVGAIYGFFPMNMGLGTGQVDLLITVLGLVCFLLQQHGYGRRAGIVLGIMTLIKPTIGVLVLYYLCRRAWPMIGAFAATLLSGLGISLLAVGGGVLWEYRQVAAGWATAFGVLPLNQSAHGLILRLLAPARDVQPTGLANLVALGSELAIGAAVVLGVSLLLRRARPATQRDALLQYYAVFTALLVALPFTENLHLTWVLPGVGILFVAMAQQRRWRPWHAWAVGSYLLLALPFAEYIAWGASASRLGRFLSGIDCYGLIALAGVLCYVAFTDGHHVLSPAVESARLGWKALWGPQRRTPERRGYREASRA